MELDSQTLKKRLRYQGRQYSNGQESRGGGRSVHMLTQAADKIDALEKALLALSRAYSDWPMNVSDEDEQLISRLLREAE